MRRVVVILIVIAGCSREQKITIEVKGDDPATQALVQAGIDLVRQQAIDFKQANDEAERLLNECLAAEKRPGGLTQDELAGYLAYSRIERGRRKADGSIDYARQKWFVDQVEGKELTDFK